jgi:dTDP-4-dehydrorhamnose 3,5-epimerase
LDLFKAQIDGVLIITPRVFEDRRGFFMESFNRRTYQEAGISEDFCQDNLSFSCKNTLRGLHYQFPHGQGKLVQVLLGEVLDVAVDVRRGSRTFGRAVQVMLSESNRRQVFIPKGFAHGFCVLSETALFAYKCSDFYAPECDRGLLWSDPVLGIEWPVKAPLLSVKDEHLPLLKDIRQEHLPEYKEGQEG